MAVPYKTFQGITCAIQLLSVDMQPFSFTVKNGNPANKVFMKGSKPGEPCFFMCGADLLTAKTVILCEAVINAITVYEHFPDTCCMALGGSTYTKKVTALKPYMDGIEKVIVCVDHDNASEKMLEAIWKILGNKVYSFRWDHTDPKGYDINDAQQAGQTDRIIDLIQNAEQIWYKTEPEEQNEKDIEPAWNHPVNMLAVLSEPPPTIKWLIDNRIPAGRGIGITGLGGSSKTRIRHP